MLPENLRTVPAVSALESAHGQSILDGKLDHGETTISIEPADIVEVCRFLKERRGFRLVSVTAVDWWPQEPRFEVVYHVHSIEHNERLRLKCGVAGGAPEIDSVSGVWRSANWYEREVFDLFGIVFRNHPDLRRIMMPDEWQGHPLRKDYPVHGHKYSYQDE
jgi:NADH-quinone oxidoreductase subunit C